jgi:hypothetical protein
MQVLLIRDTKLALDFCKLVCMQSEECEGSLSTALHRIAIYKRRGGDSCVAVQREDRLVEQDKQQAKTAKEFSVSIRWEMMLLHRPRGQSKKGIGDVFSRT